MGRPNISQTRFRSTLPITMRADPNVKGNLDLLLLAVVRTNPSHGYTIIHELARRSQGAFMLSEGAVYPALHRLEELGQVTSKWEMQENRKRRIYRITKKGQKVLGDKTREFDRFVSSVRAVLETA